MKIQSLIKIMALSSGLAMMLAACSSTGGNATGSAGQAPGAGVMTSGITGSQGGSSYYLGNDYSNQAPQDQKYYFAFDKSQVHAEYMTSIRAQAQYLASHPQAHVRLEGNTDARGSREYNIALGERRANSVAKILEVYGATRSQISVISYGEERPVALGHTEHDYQLNRRVDLIYEAK